MTLGLRQSIIRTLYNLCTIYRYKLFTIYVCSTYSAIIIYIYRHTHTLLCLKNWWSTRWKTSHLQQGTAVASHWCFEPQSGGDAALHGSHRFPLPARLVSCSTGGTTLKKQWKAADHLEVLGMVHNATCRPGQICSGKHGNDAIAAAKSTRNKN